MGLFEVLLLYIAFRLKHFACDFLFQTDWMALTKGKPGREGYRALFSHTAIHGLGTLGVTLLFAPAFWWLSIVDFVIHSIVDRIKGVVTLNGEWGVKDTMFWWLFGFDQEAHNFTHLLFIVIIVMGVQGI